MLKFLSIKHRIKKLIIRFKELQSDPHYIAMGMAIGVFVSLTPTIPFHTAIALTLAFILKGSKPAAALGVWFSNPITIPLFYIWSYQIGLLMVGESVTELQTIIILFETLESAIPFTEKLDLIYDFLMHHFFIACAMLAGGVILGILPGIAAYYITKRLFFALQERRKKHKGLGKGEK